MLAEEKGLTVTELLVAIGAMGILMAGAWTGLGILAPKFNLDNGIRTAAMAMNQARVDAITRGHRIFTVFYQGGFVIYDIDAWIADPDGDPPVTWGELPTNISTSVTWAGFSPLGTLIPNWSESVPVKVTMSNGDYTREVVVGLIGEVEIQ